MKKILSIISFLMTSMSFSQNNFIGNYSDISNSDTIPGENSEALIYTTIDILKNGTFIYSYHLNSEETGEKNIETNSGLWNLKSDTITFTFKNKIKDPEISYIIGNSNENTRVIAKNSKNKQIKFEVFGIDSIDYRTNTLFYMIPFKQLDKKIAIIKDTCYSAIHIQPEKYCESFVDCEIKVDLENIKKGTTVVVTCFNSQLESDVNNTKYILRNGFLYQLPKHKNIQDTWRLKKM